MRNLENDLRNKYYAKKMGKAEMMRKIDIKPDWKRVHYENRCLFGFILCTMDGIICRILLTEVMWNRLIDTRTI